MKSRFKVIMLLCIFTFIPYVRVMAANSTVNNIIIDGNFDDWNGKPFISDVKHDIKSPWLDFLGVGYFADDKYLYLHVQRQSSNKSEPWHFSVVILNAVKGEKQLQYPFGQSKPVYAPQFDITTYYNDDNSHNRAIVNVSFNGENIESTFSASNNGKEIEFRIPLAKVGLDGMNKEIEFMLKSDADRKHDYDNKWDDEKVKSIDWLPDNRPIIITTGPTFWQLSSIFCFMAVSFAAYRIYEKKRKN